MENIGLLTTELIKLCIPIFVGYLCVKTGYIKANAADTVAKLIAKVLLPALLFCAVMNPDLPRATIWDCRYMLLTGALWVSCAFFIGLLVAKLLKLESKKACVFMILTGMSNVAYMGTPLCTALYGEELGKLGVAMASLSGHIAMWTLGVMLISIVSSGKKAFSIKKAFSPVSIALLLGVILKVSGLNLPSIIYTPLNNIGGITPYLAMLFVGMLIAASEFKSVFKEKSIPVFLVLKLLILPLLLGLLMNTVGRLYMADTYRGLLMIEYSTSAMVSLTAYFKEEGLDADFAAKLVFTSIALNILTLPIVMFVNALY